MFRFTQNFAYLEIGDRNYVYRRVADNVANFQDNVDQVLLENNNADGHFAAEVRMVRFTRNLSYLEIGELRYIYRRIGDEIRDFDEETPNLGDGHEHNGELVIENIHL